MRAGAFPVHVAGCVGAPVAGEDGLTGSCGGRLVRAGASRVPGFLSDALDKRMGLRIESAKNEQGGRTHQIQQVPAQLPARARRSVAADGCVMWRSVLQVIPIMRLFSFKFLRLTVTFVLTGVLGVFVAFGAALLVGIVLPSLKVPLFVIISGWWLWIGWKYAQARDRWRL